jgi:hypothetical protein
MDVLLLDFFFGKLLSLFLHLGVYFVEIVVEVLKNHIKFIRDKEDLLELDDIGMIQFSEGFDLSQFDALVPIGIFLFHFFDGYHFASLGVRRFVDSAKCTVSKRLYRLIFLHCTFNLSIKSISKTSTIPPSITSSKK